MNTCDFLLAQSNRRRTNASEFAAAIGIDNCQVIVPRSSPSLTLVAINTIMMSDDKMTSLTSALESAGWQIQKGTINEPSTWILSVTATMSNKFRELDDIDNDVNIDHQTMMLHRITRRDNSTQENISTPTPNAQGKAIILQQHEPATETNTRQQQTTIQLETILEEDKNEQHIECDSNAVTHHLTANEGENIHIEDCLITVEHIDATSLPQMMPDINMIPSILEIQPTIMSKSIDAKMKLRTQTPKLKKRKRV